MRLVVDTNIIISALVKNGFTRDFIINRVSDFEFMAPAYIFSEINKYKNEIIEKAEIDEKQFYVLLDIIFKYVEIINPIFYSVYLKKAGELISHINDVPFLAAALAFNCPVWSDDKHFLQQKIVKVLKTKEIVKLRN